MDNNKTYFTISFRNPVFVTDVGFRYTLNFTDILKHLLYKYDVFNIKLETIPLGYDGGGTISCLHLRGLDWVNGYDTLNQFGDSRVLEIITQRSAVNPNSQSFISNTNAIMFRRPSDPSTVVLEFFFTDMNGNFLPRLSTNNQFTSVLSFTGVDAYKVSKPRKPLRYAYQNKPSAYWFLRSTDGENIDTNVDKQRIRRYTNVNLRSIIGNELFDKYKKFALVVRAVNGQRLDTTQTSYMTGNAWTNLWLSGNNLIFDTPSYTPNISMTGNPVSALQHYGLPVLIGYSSTPTRDDMYLEYVFLKPTYDTTDIVISYASQNALTIPPPNLTNTHPFPYFDITFEIIPVVDI